MYLRMNSLLDVFIMYIIVPPAMISGIMQASPSCQLIAKIRTAAITGTSRVAARSGSWCARKEWVMPALSSIILRMRPLVVLSKNPRGISTTLFIASLRMLDSTRKAARCEDIRARK